MPEWLLQFYIYLSKNQKNAISAFCPDVSTSDKSCWPP